MISAQNPLGDLLPRIGEADWIALDTEADSLHAYPEKLCLLQLSFPGGDVLIDPLAGLDLQPLFQRLQNKELILHGADYDLRLLHRAFQFVPHAVFDTMWAARLLGYEEFGLGNLTRRHLGVELEKGPQKMNWALRPLPPRMAVYATNDTHYLQPLAEILRAGLKERGRLAWHSEVCARVIRESIQPRQEDPDNAWRIRGSDRLDRAGMAVLREVWRWREQEALAANKPPYFILSHEKLVALANAAARGRPCDPLLPRHFHPKRAARLALALQQGVALPPSEHPQPRRRSGQRLSAQQRAFFDELKLLRDARAAELAIDPTLIVSKAELMQLALDPVANQKALLTWQRRLLFSVGRG